MYTASPVGWSYRLCRLNFYRGERTTLIKSVLDITLNFIKTLLQSWRFGNCQVPLHYYYFPVNSDPEWEYLFYLWVKKKYFYLWVKKKYFYLWVKKKYFWPGVRVLVLSLGQKEIFLFLYMKPFNCVQTNELCKIELLALRNNTWNYLTVCIQMNNVEQNY